MLSATVPLNRYASCVTMTIARRRSFGMQLTQVDAVEGHAAARRVVEPRHELGERRLAGAGRADERDRLTGGDVEREVGQDGAPVAVAELDVVEPDVAPRLPQVDRLASGREPSAPPPARPTPSRAPPSRTGTSSGRTRPPAAARRSCARTARRRAACRSAIDPSTTRMPPHSSDERDGHRGDGHEPRLERAEEADRAHVDVAVVARDSRRTRRRCAPPCGTPSRRGCRSSSRRT